jgi:hypothetical protein
MGYNPFRPHISTNNQSHDTISSPALLSPTLSSPPLSRGPSLTPQISAEGLTEDSLLQIESALQTLSLSPEDESPEDAAKRKICCETSLKMLSNIRKNPLEPKFR